MDRRDTLSALLALGASASPMSLRAQKPAEVRRMGVTYNWRTPPAEELATGAGYRAAREKFEALGWVEGRNFAVERLFSEGVVERIPGLIDELIRRRVEVIWVANTFSAVAAVRATKTIPIVIAGASAYPVECGLIQSFARPGGNLTGVAWFQGIEAHSKLAQFLREMLPGARRLAWLVFPADLATVSGGEFNLRPYYTKVARNLGFELGYYECRKAEELEALFDAMRNWGAHAVVIEPASMGYDERDRIASLTLQHRLPSANGIYYNAVAGGLFSYAPDIVELWGQAATYVDRILRGARPADLPVEMPRTLKLTINRKTAKALGVAIPHSMLVLADEVVE